MLERSILILEGLKRESDRKLFDEDGKKESVTTAVCGIVRYEQICEVVRDLNKQ
jgi:hypothetical protein